MTGSAPHALLVDHPALAVPEVGQHGLELGCGGQQASGRWTRRRRIRIALQLTALASLLAEFDLWIGRRALTTARLVGTDDGPQAVVGAVPRSLSRLWRRLGGGEAAADATREAVVAAVAEASGLPTALLRSTGTAPGFFLGPQIELLLGELPRPLDPVTARNLWAVRWDVPPLPADGEVCYWAVPDPRLGARFGASVWAASRRRGANVWLWRVGTTEESIGPLPPAGGVGTLVVTGRPTADDLAAVSRWVERPGCSAVVAGAFPDGWQPPPPPGFDATRLTRHLALVGLPLYRGRQEVERLAGRFDPLRARDRGRLTEAARWLWDGARTRGADRPEGRLGRFLGMLPEGVPEGLVQVICGGHPATLRREAEELGAVLQGGRWRLPEARPLGPDDLHRHLVGLFEVGDPRRLRHQALAERDPCDLLAWARDRLEELEGGAVRDLLAGLAPGVLGDQLQLALVEACLNELDVAGAREALAGVEEGPAGPWRAWLAATDAPASLALDLVDDADQERAPRAAAEVALFLLRRAVRQGSGGAERFRKALEASCGRLRGAARRRFELELAALERPDRLEDRGWRRRTVAGNPVLHRRLLHLRALQLAVAGCARAARRLLRLAAVGEHAPARLGLLQLDLGFVALGEGRCRDSDLHLLRAHRLLETAGLVHRTRLVLFNLAVSDLDRLEVVRAGERLQALAEAGPPDPFIAGEQVRLALAKGDEPAFRHLLAKHPVAQPAAAPLFDANLGMLRGVAALLDGDPTAARRLLAAADDAEGRSWLALVDALAGEWPGADSGPDDWGLARAARLMWLARRARFDEARREAGSGASTRPYGALAIALTERLLGPQPWVDRELRGAAAGVLDRAGLTGWARVLRRRASDPELAMAAMTRLVEAGGFQSLAEEQVDALLAALGLGGIEVRSTSDGDRLLRWGNGDPGTAVVRGRHVAVPLGGDPGDDPAWRLLLGLIDLLAPQQRGGEPSEVEDTGMHGSSPGIRRLRGELRRFAPTGLGVLLRGETGVGKEVAARALHRLSGRTGRFVPVNVAAVPAELLEAELFGSVRGAFTGAERSRRGLVEAADGGTLFLDEIGDVDLRLQVKLLRFLESREVRPVGSDQFHRIDVRVVSATHQDLDRRIAEGSFRQDLYYRIAMVPVTIPPLRERREDILGLKAVLEEEARRNGLPRCRWSPEAEGVLLRYRWPGNVRELRHVVEVAMVRAGGDLVLPAHLPITAGDDPPQGRWEDALEDFRRSFVAAALRRNSGNRSATARELGISRQALLYQIRRLGL